MKIQFDHIGVVGIAGKNSTALPPFNGDVIRRAISKFCRFYG